jgi:predicted O-methyltransferase YrrM
MEGFIDSRLLNDYIEKYSSDEDPLLAELRRITFLKAVNPRMISGPVQGKFLELIGKMTAANRILEIGTFTGYSAICLARGLSEEGRIYTIEINDELSEISDNYFERSGLAYKIKALTGDARKIIPELNETFDLAFIDGEKEQYIEYYEASLQKIRTGGVILVDNVLWDGKVFHEPDRMDGTTKAIHSFNEYILNDERVENLLLPLRDGLNLIRKK